MTWQRPALFWVVGLVSLVSAVVMPGSVSLLGVLWILVACLGVLVAVALHVWVRRPGLLEVSLGVTLLLAWMVGPRPGLSAVAVSLGLALVGAAYFTFKLEARVREDKQDTTEGRQRTHEAVVFGSQRILVVCFASAALALAVFHVPVLSVGLVSDRWAISLDAASTPVLAALAMAFLFLAVGWTLLRLGRQGPSTARLGDSEVRGETDDG